MAKTMEELLAIDEIKNVHLRFCRANDRRDEELMRSCFHPDAVIELHETFDVEAFIALGRSALDHFIGTWHNTGNQLVRVDGDVGWAEHYTTATHRIAGGDAGPERDLIVFERCLDETERRDGVWRIKRRKMVIDFMRTDPVAPGSPDAGPQGGARDKTDPSYTFLKSDR